MSFETDHQHGLCSKTTCSHCHINGNSSSSNDEYFTFDMVVYPAGTWIFNGWGVSSADIDNDGDPEIYGGRLFVNEYPEPGGWVKVKVVGSGDGATNVSAVGAIVRVTADDGVTRHREVTTGTGTGCQQPLEQLIGLGDSATATVEVVFPTTGTIVDAGSVDPGTRLVVHEDGTVETR